MLDMFAVSFFFRLKVGHVGIRILDLFLDAHARIGASPILNQWLNKLVESGLTCFNATFV
jgi:hypothetical protein